MKIVIVSASHRKDSQSEKVSKYLNQEFSKKNIQSEIVLLAENPLPLWDEGVWSETQEWKNLWSPVSAKLKNADGFVFVVPEWGGMVPPGFKNFMLLCSTELAHKPALIVTVSSGLGGSYPISEIRMSGYKNTHVCYLPSHIIIRNVEKVLNGSQINTQVHEDQLRPRIDYNLDLLIQYTTALSKMRESTKIDLNKFPYGM